VAGSGSGEDLARVLNLELETAKASSTNFLDESKLLADLKKSLIPLVFLVRHHNLRRGFTLEEGWDTLANKLVRDKSDDDADWYREESQYDRVTPLRAVQRLDGYRLATNEDDQNLKANHDAVDPNEEIVPRYTLEDIEAIVKSSAVELIENLHPYKCVEDECVHLLLLFW